MLNLDVRNLMIENSTRMDFNKKKVSTHIFQKRKKVESSFVYTKVACILYFPIHFFF